MKERADLSKYFAAAAKKPWFRAAFGIAAPSAVVGGLLYLYFKGNPFICIVHLLTGLYTPGCGAGRALSALLRFKIAEAIDYNVLFVLALPFIAYYFLSEYLKIVVGRYVIPQIKMSFKGYFIVITVFLIFGIVRNFPFMPFAWLAP
jgi:hypothetical protein